MVKRDFIRDILLVILVILVLLLLRIFVFSTYRVTQADANSYLKKGDLITFTRTSKPDYKEFVVYEAKGHTHIGRIIGDPHDSITYMDDIFYRNKKIASQSYINPLKKKFHIKNHKNQNPFTADFTVSSIRKSKSNKIPKGSYLILNDQRSNKQDSRTFGLIKRSQIKGVVTFRVLPLGHFGFVKTE
ncbi:signal peptidase I [Streptococcus macacae]|uniref:Signal peptidase I n=1 Tax=Streptococcus macacae NCTC 11558 TaxID=764298 RepID=G5JVJ2_9STRE|nr:signal peptidase I [Streptococcus macacae]EHJ52961.1 signal peptidase I [Streptococcus macacae NCTC 11558]SUN78586.1 signal peptidase I [Streptococcus macacae NCTC 11558]